MAMADDGAGQRESAAAGAPGEVDSLLGQRGVAPELPNSGLACNRRAATILVVCHR
jgi:hypothetical protein